MWLVSLAAVSLMALPNVIHVVGDSYQQLSRIRDTTLSLPPRPAPRPPTEIILLTSEQAEADVVASAGGGVEVAPSDSTTRVTRSVESPKPPASRVPTPRVSTSARVPSTTMGDPVKPKPAAPQARERVNSGRTVAPK